ncbi:13790_t:CDS:2, partial [Racocetra persica]
RKSEILRINYAQYEERCFDSKEQRYKAMAITGSVPSLADDKKRWLMTELLSLLKGNKKVWVDDGDRKSDILRINYAQYEKRCFDSKEQRCKAMAITGSVLSLADDKKRCLMTELLSLLKDNKKVWVDDGAVRLQAPSLSKEKKESRWQSCKTQAISTKKKKSDILRINYAQYEERCFDSKEQRYKAMAITGSVLSLADDKKRCLMTELLSLLKDNKKVWVDDGAVRLQAPSLSKEKKESRWQS